MRKSLLALALLSAAGVLGGCSTTDLTHIPITPPAPPPPSAPTLVAIVVLPAATSLEAGTAQQFSAIGSYSDGSTADVTGSVTWTATGGSISSSGLFTAGAVGPGSVTATLGGVSGSTSVTITGPPPAPPLVSILVLPSAMSLATGASQQYTAIGTYGDGSTQDVTGAVTWTSTGGSISTSGLFSASVAGSGSVTATLGSVSGSTSVTITSTPAPPALVSILVLPEALTLQTGTARQYSAIGAYSNGSSQPLTSGVTWSTTGGSITAGGLFTAGAAGAGSVTATVGGVSGSTSVTVTTQPPPPPATPTLVSLTLSPTSATLQSGASQHFVAVGHLSDGSLDSTPAVAWSATGGSVTTGGVYTAGSTAGSYAVIARSGTVQVSAPITISASPAPPTLASLTLSPTSAALLTGASKQFAVVGHMSDGSVVSAPVVTWTATGGTVTSGGVYTAGGVAGSYAVTAKSGAIQVSAPITISGPPTLTSLTLAPTSAALVPGSSKQFVAVGHMSDGSVNSAPAVTWSATGGTVTSGGLYTAGATTGSFSVTAKSGTVQVSAPIVISVSQPPPSPSSGQLAFERACSSCHTAKDGFDLAYFSYPDTAIIRRALKHVNSATASLIASYIVGMNTPHVSQSLRLFQPGGSTAASDVDFAVRALGQDGWPTTMTVSQLRAIDPLQLRIVPKLLIWSDEGSNLDWMPDDSLPVAILNYSGGAGANALAAYNRSPTTQNLIAAVTALYDADHASANAGAPCMFFVASRVNYKQCFEVRRWISSLVAQHMLRNGITRPLATPLHSIWWEVGDAARRSQGHPGQVANTTQNWVAWMYLGWMFDPANVAAVYTAGGLRQLGLPRHATFVALRSLVARPFASLEEDHTVWADFREFAGSVPTSWAVPAANFALHHLLDRLHAGDRPLAGTETTIAIANVKSGMSSLATKVSAASLAPLTTLGNQVISLLQN